MSSPHENKTVSFQRSDLAHALVCVVGRDHCTKNPKTQKRGGHRQNNKPTVVRGHSDQDKGTAESRAALKIARSVGGPNNKYINSVYNGVTLAFATTTAPYIFLLNGVAQGTSENTRVGRLTKNRWLDLNLVMYANSNLTTNGQVAAMRFYIVVETTALGSAISASQFFLDSTTFTPTSQRDRTNRNPSRFVVLYDSKAHLLGGSSQASGQVAPVIPGAGQPMQRNFDIHLPLDFQTDYSRGNAGTVADIDSNSLYLVGVTDCASTSCVYYYGGYTLCFNDDS